jgi:hypothetical protein
MAEPENPQSPAIIREVDSGATFEVWQGPQGSMRLDWSRKGVMRVLMLGHGHGEFAPVVNRRLEMVLRFTGRFSTFGDFWDLHTYDSAFRVDQAKWVDKHRAQFEGSQILVRSKLVAMGVSVANLALGGKIKVYSQRAEFDRQVVLFGFPLSPPMPK